MYVLKDALALSLGTKRKWHYLTLDDLTAVAESAGVNRLTLVGTAAETVKRFHGGEEDDISSLPMDTQLRCSIERRMIVSPAIESVLSEARTSRTIKHEYLSKLDQ